MFRLVVFASFVFVGSLSSSTDAGADQAASAGDAHPGVKVYAAQKCAMCHSIAGVGKKKLLLDGVGAKLTTAQIREWITHPAEAAKKANSTIKPPMRAYPNLSKGDLDALAGYLTTLGKK